MNIVLINPRVLLTPMHPLGLLYVAAVLEKEGHKVRVYDPLPEDDAFIRFIKRDKPNMVGLTCSTPQRERAVYILNKIEKMNSNIKTVVGGVHATILPQEMLTENSVDFVVIGEGEHTIIELCEAIERDSGFDKINGIGFKEKGKVIVNPRRKLIKNLDGIPFPARHLLSSDWYFQPPGRIRGFWLERSTAAITSRGCPYSCIFCSTHLVFGRKTRQRSPENVILEISHLIDTYKIDGLFFVDDTFTLNSKWVKHFCYLMKKEKIDIKWACQARVDRVTEPLIKIMKKAGCVQIDYGVESGSVNVLKALRKGITPDQAKEAFKITKKIGVRTMASFMIGNPREKYEDIVATLQLAKEIKPDYTLFFYTIPRPATELYHMAIQNKWIDLPISNQEWINIPYAPIMEINFTKKRLMEIRRRLQNQFVFRNWSLFMKNPIFLLRLSLMYVRCLPALKYGLKRYLKTGEIRHLVECFDDYHLRNSKKQLDIRQE